ncbi:hypothetical protein SDJN03_22467, partial [Cucurbita argyrosperma subsp. sororia]
MEKAAGTEVGNKKKTLGMVSVQVCQNGKAQQRQLTGQLKFGSEPRARSQNLLIDRITSSLILGLRRLI